MKAKKVYEFVNPRERKNGIRDTLDLSPKDLAKFQEWVRINSKNTIRPEKILLNGDWFIIKDYMMIENNLPDYVKKLKMDDFLGMYNVDIDHLPDELIASQWYFNEYKNTTFPKDYLEITGADFEINEANMRYDDHIYEIPKKIKTSGELRLSHLEYVDLNGISVISDKDIVLNGLKSESKQANFDLIKAKSVKLYINLLEEFTANIDCELLIIADTTMKYLDLNILNPNMKIYLSGTPFIKNMDKYKKYIVKSK